MVPVASLLDLLSCYPVGTGFANSLENYRILRNRIVTRESFSMSDIFDMCSRNFKCKEAMHTMLNEIHRLQESKLQVSNSLIVYTYLHISTILLIAM